MQMESLVRDTYATQSSGDIQPLQWAILRYVKSHPSSECTMSLIRISLHRTHAPVVRAIQTLVKRNLIEQVDHPKDRRSKVLVLTNVGLKVLENDPILKLVRRFDLLPKKELRSFKNAIDTMSKELRTHEN